MKFPDAAYYGSVAQWNAVMAHEGADDFAFYIPGDYALHAWAPGDVIALRTGGRRGMGIHVTSIVGRDGAADGTYFARLNLTAYGARAGDRFCLDMEPGVYRGNPGACAVYCPRWAAAVRAVAALAEVAPPGQPPMRAVVEVNPDNVVLSCFHVLARHRRLERVAPAVGDRFPCHDCAMEGRR